MCPVNNYLSLQLLKSFGRGDVNNEHLLRSVCTLLKISKPNLVYM